MVRESLENLRHVVAQKAARIMVEDGVHDFAYAKKKAGRQLGVSEKSVLPTNAEIEEEVRLYHQLFNSNDQPHELRQLREAALATMVLFERFNPFLTGSVLDGSAGKNAQTDIYLFADSAKDVEIFLLSQDIPFESSEKTYRVSDRPSKDKKDKVRKTVPVFTLETEFGLQKLTVFSFDDMRVTTKRPSNGSNATKASITDLQQLI